MPEFGFIGFTKEEAHKILDMLDCAYDRYGYGEEEEKTYHTEKEKFKLFLLALDQQSDGGEIGVLDA